MEKKKNCIGLVIGFAGAMAGVFVVNVLNRYVLISFSLIGKMICLPAIYWLIAVVPIILMICYKDQLSMLGFSKDKAFLQLLAGIAIGLVMSVILTLLPHLIGLGSFVDNGKRYVHLWQFIYEFTYCILAIGAVEEFVFRGYLYSKIKNLSEKGYVAVIGSSILFGLLHVFTGNIIQVFMTMLLGILWCILRLRIKNCSILSLMIAHGIYDAMITVWASFLLR